MCAWQVFSLPPVTHIWWSSFVFRCSASNTLRQVILRATGKFSRGLVMPAASVFSGFYLRLAVGPNKKLQVRPVEMGSGKGRDDAGHCASVHVWLTGNLEHIIQRVVLPSSACVSGTVAGVVIGLRRRDNAAVESVWGHVKERWGTRGALRTNPLAVCFFSGCLFPELKLLWHATVQVLAAKPLSFNMYCTFLKALIDICAIRLSFSIRQGSVWEIDTQASILFISVHPVVHFLISQLLMYVVVDGNECADKRFPSFKSQHTP